MVDYLKPIGISEKRKIIEALGYRVAYGSAADLDGIESWLWSHESFGLAAFFVDSENDAVFWAYEDAMQMFGIPSGAVLADLQLAQLTSEFSFAKKFEI